MTTFIPRSPTIVPRSVVSPVTGSIVCNLELSIVASSAPLGDHIQYSPSSRTGPGCRPSRPGGAPATRPRPTAPSPSSLAVRRVSLVRDPAAVGRPLGGGDVAEVLDEHALLAGLGVHRDEIAGRRVGPTAGVAQDLAVRAEDGRVRCRAVGGARCAADRVDTGERGQHDGHGRDRRHGAVHEESATGPPNGLRRVGRRRGDRVRTALEHLADVVLVDHRGIPSSPSRSVCIPRETSDRTVPAEHPSTAAVWTSERSS